MPGIIGKKLGMSQIIQDDGRVIPVTFVQCQPNEVVQVKTKETDGYPAIVLGFDAYHKPSKNKTFKVVKEFRVQDPAAYKKGEKVTLESLKEISSVTVSAVSKGKGFQGVMKRYNFKGGPASHGSNHIREIGSIGACAHPARVIKGKRMPGHMGDELVTLKNRLVVQLVPEKDVIALHGPLPGANSSYIFIKF